MSENNLGLGAMFHWLGGGSPESASDYYGRTIAAAKLQDNEVFLQFTDGITLKIWDDAQSCCEVRYITCDDDWDKIVTGKLIEILIKHAPTDTEDWQDHEQAFIEIKTDKGWVTFCNHNEHNGYYGGFGFSAAKVKHEWSA